MATAQTVTLGVPVYRGERYIVETLQSIKDQTFRDWEVVISLDGPDPAAEELCAPFLADSRFRLVVQPERLGWVGNLNWLMAHVETPYWCYQQQDDVLDPRYLESLVRYANQTPEAAVVYCDIETFGALSWTFVQLSVTGSPHARQLTLLYEHIGAVAFRGVTRVEALRLSGGIPPNAVDNFLCDAAWMSSVARWGDLRRVPGSLYRKRYHSANEHTKWTGWPLEKRTRGWILHCVAMLEQAMLVDATPQERRLLWLAAVARLVSERTAVHYVPVHTLTAAQRTAMLDTFIACVRETAVDVPALLEAGWDDVLQWTRGFYERRDPGR